MAQTRYMFDPLTGQNKELPEEEVIQSPVAQAMSDQPDPKEAFVKIGGTGDESRDNMIQAFMRGMQERSVLLNKDPSEVLDTMLDKVSPGKMMLTNMLHGAGAALLNQPFKTVRESLYERLVEQQKIKLQQQQNDSLRLQQFMSMDSRERNVDVQEANRNYRTDATNTTRLSTADLARLTARESLEQREKFAETKNAQWDKSFNADEAQREIDNSLKGRSIDLQEKALDERRAYHNASLKAKKDGVLYTPPPTGDDFFDTGLSGLVMGLTGLDKKSFDAERDKIAKQRLAVEELPEGPEKQQRIETLRNDTRDVYRQVLNQSSASDKDAINQLESVVTSLDNMRALMKQLGPETNFIYNKEQNVLRFLGKQQEIPTQLQNQILRAVQSYRKAITGAAFNEIEAKEFDALFPSLKNEWTMNQAILDDAELTSAQMFRNRMVGRFGAASADTIFGDTHPTGGKVLFMGGKYRPIGY